MILYSTVLQGKDGLNQEALLRSILSQAGTDQLNRLLAYLTGTGIKKVYPEGSCKRLDIITDKGRAITTVKSEKVESGYTLSREYVLNEKTHTLSLKTYIRNYIGETICLDMFGKSVPKSLCRMIDADLISEDNSLSISYEPLRLNDNNIQYFFSIIDGSISCTLPIVYIVPSISGKYPMSVDAIAHQLTGLAHIVVPEDKKILKKNQCRHVKFKKRLRFSMNSLPE